MTKDELNELTADCPVLYHMAEHDSWPSIRDNGLLSTTALLDRYKVFGSPRDKIESKRRPENVVLKGNGLDSAVVRDQIPMDDAGLMRCLQDGLLPENWYRLLNAKVFFWLTRERLLRLLNAGSYRLKEHDVIMLDTRTLIHEYREKIWFCPINSGCTKPFPHPRGKNAFQRISDYPYAEWRKKRTRGERVVELAIDYAVPNVADFVIRVVRMKASEERNVVLET